MGATQVKVGGSNEPRTQSQDSRDEILKAAMHLFANRGFHETSMSEVAREARASLALIEASRESAANGSQTVKIH